MACNHSDKALWIGKADGIYCRECGEKIDLTKPAPKKAAPAADPEPEKKAPAKKAPTVKKTTTGRAKK